MNQSAKKLASCQAGKALGEFRDTLLSRANRLSQSYIARRVIRRTPWGQALSGLCLVAVLFSTFVAWHIAFSRQPQAGSYPDPDFTIVVLPIPSTIRMR